MNDENMTYLSIIIPVYNVELYLGRCIDSLLEASGIEKTEIILVEDGSTDNSGSIADSYAGKYEFISCYHKEGRGLSDARNYGLNRAKGKYIFFFDSDDKIVPDKFSKIIEAAANSDAEVLLWDGVTINEKDEVFESAFDKILVHRGLNDKAGMITGTDAMVSQIKDHGRIAMTAWLRACRRDYLLDNKLFFEEGIYHEDELWTPLVMTGASKVLYIPEKVYCYRIRDNSLMTSMKNQDKHAGDQVHVLNQIYAHYEEKISDKSKRGVLLANWAETYLWTIKNYEVWKYDCSRQIPRGKILASAGSFKAKCKALLLCLFGVKFYCRLAGSPERSNA
ncbi:MAG: glycosyltransferase [Clostridiales bacterium]|nr:glycosyltransferase [Clostridiales bacterium]